jgi:uncharacterized protein YkwD
VPVLELELVPELKCAARLRASELLGDGPGDGDPRDIFEHLIRAGYTGLPRHEITAFDFVDVEAVLEAWLASPTHCAAIVDRAIDEFGAGHARSARGDEVVWVLATGEHR